MSIVLWDGKPKARKAHRCDVCSRRIEPGETYLRMRGTFDGEPMTEKQCSHCQALIAELLRRDTWASDFADEGLPEIAEWAAEFGLLAARAAFLAGWLVGTPGTLCDAEELAEMLALGRPEASA